MMVTRVKAHDDVATESTTIYATRELVSILMMFGKGRTWKALSYQDWQYSVDVMPVAG